MPVTNRESVACRALVGIHLTRARSTAWASALAVAAMSSIDILRHGLSVDTTVPWLLGASLTIPLAPGFSIIREKTDGSLRYFSSLPVSGRVHAVARAATSALTSVIAAGVAAIAVALKFPASSPAIVVATFAASWLGLSAISLAIVAVQLRVSVGQAAKRIVLGMGAVVVGLQLIGAAQERGAFDHLKERLFTQEGLLVVSITFWLLLGAVFAASMRSIAKTSVTYRAEPSTP